MTEDLRSELENMIGPVQWEWLKPHTQRDAVVIVDAALALAEVGEALATDNTQLVSRWITEQLIGKPTAAQLSLWNSGHPEFSSLIVQPYVLVHLQQPDAVATEPSD
jgi:hypothetical protein